MSNTPVSVQQGEDDECPARYRFADGDSVGCERGPHVGLPVPKPDEHLCAVTLIEALGQGQP